jgi:hypothetical protein
MANPPHRATVDSGSYQRAGLLAIAGAVLLATHAVFAGVIGDDVPVVLQISPFFLCAAVVTLAITLTAIRGRNLGIALGMTGSVVGVASGLSEAIRGTPGPLFAASFVLAFVGALIVGLSFPKPRGGYPKYAVYAALSGAALLVLTGAIGILADDRYAALAYLVPALAWGWLGRVLLGPHALPRRSGTAASLSGSAAGQRTTPRTRPPGQTKARPKRKPRKAPKRR